MMSGMRETKTNKHKLFVQEILNHRNFTKKVSFKWVGEFLKGLGLSWQLVTRGDHEKFGTKRASLARHRLRLKLHCASGQHDEVCHSS